MTFRIEAVSEQSWRQFRDLRREMLADSPKAFVETLDSASRESDERWRERASQTNSRISCGFAATDATGGWIAVMRSRIEDGQAYLLGVYVTPERRAEGVADALLSHIEQWVQAQGHDSLTLEVHEENHRAQAFYLRMGFTATGATVPYPLDPREREIVMTKRMTD